MATRPHNTGIRIGAHIDKQALDILTSSIVSILQASPSPKTARLALKAFNDATKVENVTMSNVSVNMPTK